MSEHSYYCCSPTRLFLLSLINMSLIFISVKFKIVSISYTLRQHIKPTR